MKTTKRTTHRIIAEKIVEETIEGEDPEAELDRQIEADIQKVLQRGDPQITNSKALTKK